MGLKHKARDVMKQKCHVCRKRKVYNVMTWVTHTHVTGERSPAYVNVYTCGECRKEGHP